MAETHRSRNVASVLVVLVLLAGISIGIYLIQRKPEPAATPQQPAGPSSRQVLATARFQVRTGRVTQAMQLLVKYLAANPADREARIFLAELHLQQDQDARAEALVDAILAEDPNWPPALWLKGGILEPRDPAQAEIWYRRAAAQPNAGQRIWSAWGRALLAQGQIVQGMDQLQKAYAAGARSPEVILPLAARQMREGLYDQAAELLAQARRQDPQAVEAYVMGAACAKEQNQLDRAEALFRQALALPMGPDRQATVLMEIGRLAGLDHRWVESAEAFARAGAFRPLRGPASLESAQAYFHAEKYALAMEQIDRAWPDMAGYPEAQRWRKRIEDARFGAPESDAKEGWFGPDTTRPRADDDEEEEEGDEAGGFFNP